MMAENNETNIINTILSGKEDKPSPEMEDLNCLIYRSSSDLSETEGGSKESSNIWEFTKGDVSIQIWESKAKIRVKIPPATKQSISISRIAKIAMNAIFEELKKGGK